LRSAIALAAAVLLACAPRQDGTVDPGAGAPDELAATLNVVLEGRRASVELHVMNTTSAALMLEFASAQRYDFEISNGAGERLWRWSEDMLFAQMLGEEVIAAGESVRYQATWTPAGPGAYVATGRLVSTNYPVELRTTFQVPAD
jgi:hypothetical protein